MTTAMATTTAATATTTATRTRPKAMVNRSDPLTSACSSFDVSPLQRGVLSTALRDLALAVGWCDLRVLLLPGTQWAAIVGHKRRELAATTLYASAPGSRRGGNSPAPHAPTPVTISLVKAAVASARAASPALAAAGFAPQSVNNVTQEEHFRRRRAEAVPKRALATDTLRAVLPLPLHTTALTPSTLHAIFSALGKLTPDELPAPIADLAPSVDALRAEYAARSGKPAGEGMPLVTEENEEPRSGTAAIDTDTLYVAIGSPDSTVVYYKLSRGIKKPADIPDE